MIINTIKKYLSRTGDAGHSSGIDRDTKGGLAADIKFIELLLGQLSADDLGRLKSLLTREQGNLDDENVRYQLAEALSMAIYPKYKFSEFGREFLEDKEFLEYYKKFMDPNNWHSMDRKYTLKQLLQLVSTLEGDLVESGAYKGASAWLMCEAYKAADKTVHLFDSFEGLSHPGEKDGDYWVAGALRSSESVLRESLQQFQNFTVYKGWIPDVFQQYNGGKVCFLHVDVDLYDPTYHSLDYFYPRLVSQGIILMDDYGFTSCPGAKLAADNFFKDKPESLVSLPTGQGLVIKK